jgi:hypothetical protein
MIAVIRICLRLLEGFRSRIISAGRRRTTLMLEMYQRPGGVFHWAPWVFKAFLKASL